MDTETLIRSLAEKVEPVRPLQSPWRRTGVWAAIAAMYVVVLVIVMSPRSDLAARLGEPGFLFEQTAALLTGLAAAVAAFASVVPGASRRMALLPLVLRGDRPGHEIEYPMAVVILGGLVTSTILNLLFVPGLYARFRPQFSAPPPTA